MAINNQRQCTKKNIVFSSLSFSISLTGILYFYILVCVCKRVPTLCQRITTISIDSRTHGKYLLPKYLFFFSYSSLHLYNVYKNTMALYINYYIWMQCLLYTHTHIAYIENVLHYFCTNYKFWYNCEIVLHFILIMRIKSFYAPCVHCTKKKEKKMHREKKGQQEVKCGWARFV